MIIDMVACHALPTCKGRGVLRVICRLKYCNLAHKISQNRKNTKSIGSTKKPELAARPNKGFAIQPNLTPTRAKLLAQVNDVAKTKNWHAAWVDCRNGTIMLKLQKSGRPIAIRTTNDLKFHAGRDFNFNDYYFCARDTCDFYGGNDNDLEEDLNTDSVFSPSEPTITGEQC